MKTIIRISIILFAINICFAEDPSRPNLDSFIQNIHKFAQSSIKIDAVDKIIYIDPFRIQKKDSADIILITHDHRDHLDPSSIVKILTSKTTIVAPASCKEKIQELAAKKVVYFAPREEKKIDTIIIESVPAYNIKKKRFHPQSKNYLAYIITIDGIRIYHAGDTERIPEMKKFQCDIAFIPLGQTYTMNSVKEAAEAVLDVGASIAIPIHFGLYEGSSDDAIEFQKLLNGKVKVIILPDESVE
ncbi:MAG: MBL fold metallo-hydrolase [Candidatus Marinimicrobia bacterium]|nr:MBL fold metallo-hydrolase [bacterium]MCG2715935.1 MBL fold metallo-hydrolase [Candidatus Neomarinimicrobiota bacterium]